MGPIYIKELRQVCRQLEEEKGGEEEHHPEFHPHQGGEGGGGSGQQPHDHAEVENTYHGVEVGGNAVNGIEEKVFGGFDILRAVQIPVSKVSGTFEGEGDAVQGQFNEKGDGKHQGGHHEYGGDLGKQIGAGAQPGHHGHRLPGVLLLGQGEGGGDADEQRDQLYQHHDGICHVVASIVAEAEHLGGVIHEQCVGAPKLQHVLHEVVQGQGQQQQEGQQGAPLAQEQLDLGAGGFAVHTRFPPLDSCGDLVYSLYHGIPRQKSPFVQVQENPVKVRTGGG